MAFDRTEMDYCRALVESRGNDSVGRNPAVVASYLRLQASSAFRAGDYEAAARLGHAASQINWSADNLHPPRWSDAALALGAVKDWPNRDAFAATRRVVAAVNKAILADENIDPSFRAGFSQGDE